MNLLQQRGLAEQATLTIIGGGHPDYEGQLRRMTAEYGLTDRVHFVGRLPRGEIAAQLKNFDVFLFTSTWAEPFGRTLLEAMAAGLVVIGSNVGGSGEILREYASDMMFEASDAAALADRLEHVLGDPARRIALARAGRELVLNHYTMQRMTDRLEQWWGEIAQ